MNKEHPYVMPTDSQYLTTKQLAERYGVKPATIKGWRAERKGPEFYTVPRIAVAYGSSRVRYDLHHVLAWEQTHSITPLNHF